MFFAPPQPTPPAIVQEVRAERSQANGASGASGSGGYNVGPPNSAMTEKKLDIKRLGDFVYGAIVVIEGTAVEYIYEHSHVIRFYKSGRNALGLKVFGPSPIPKYAPLTPFWMDTNSIRSGPNVVQRNYSLGWGY